MNRTEIQTSEPFDKIFPITDGVLSGLVSDMRRQGYDPAQPVVVWKGRNILIDGHTRLKAAEMAGIDDIPVVERAFDDEDEAVRYSIHCQRDRRNLTDVDITRLVTELNKRMVRGGDRKSDEAKSKAQDCAIDRPRKSASEIAEIIGTSTRKVEQARTIIDKATPEVRAAVESGEMSINRAYNETRKPKEEKQKPGKKHGSFEDWKKLRDLFETVQDAVKQMECLKMDTQHKIQARSMCEAMSGRFGKLAQKLVE